MKRKIFNLKIILSALVIFSLGTGLYFNRVKIKEIIFDWSKKELPAPVNYSQTKKLSFVNGSIETIDIIPINADLKMPDKGGAAATSDKANAIPDQYNLNIPFTSQAPYKIWDDAHKEACEETSALMAAYFIKGKTIANAAAADKEILALIEWEKKNFGF